METPESSNNNMMEPSDPEGSNVADELCGKLMEHQRSGTNVMMTKWSMHQLSVRMSSPEARHPFTPCIVAIGPLHWGMVGLNHHLEELKLRYMSSVLCRKRMTTSSINTSPSEEGKRQVFKACVRGVLDLESEVRLYYSTAVKDVDTTRLVEILLLDGCFILELFIRYYASVFGHLHQDDPLLEPHHHLLPPEDADVEDPILGFSWILSAVRRDLALIENQIPFTVLQKVFEVITGRDTNLPHDFLATMAFHFFQSPLQQAAANPPLVSVVAVVMERRLHRVNLLNLLLNYYHPSVELEAAQTTRNSNYSRRRPAARKTFFLSATSLAEVGLRFTKKSSGRLLDIQFPQGQGVFEIPPLHITRWTDSLFRNLVAFERCCPDRKPYVASYLVLMNRLITTSKDIRFLESKEILTSDLGSDDHILAMFNNIAGQLDLQEFCYQELCETVESSYNTMWKRYMKELRNQYFRNPWALMAFVVALVLLLTSVLQTIYMALSFYQ